MKVLFDTNVILDVLLDRKPFSEASTKAMALAETGKVKGYLCATTVTTLHYLAEKVLGRKKAKTALEQLLEIFQTAPVDHEILKSALVTSSPDYEDAVIIEAGTKAGIQALVTRNPKDFKAAHFKILTPEELSAMLSSSKA